MVCRVIFCQRGNKLQKDPHSLFCFSPILILALRRCLFKSLRRTIVDLDLLESLEPMDAHDSSSSSTAGVT